MSQELSAGDLCTRRTIVCAGDMPLTEAAALMREQHVGCLVVVAQGPEGQLPVGLLTDRDIVTAVLARGLAPGSLRVEDVMSRELATARDGDSALTVLARMRRRGVRRLPVVDERGLLLGLLTLDDMLELIGEEIGAIVQALASGGASERLHRP